MDSDFLDDALLDDEPVVNTKRGSLKRSLSLMVASLLIGYGAGRVHEAYDNFFYESFLKMQVVSAAYNGYSFSREGDREFFSYRPFLYKDPKTRIMIGVLLKNDSTVIGPIRKHSVGWRWYERLGIDAKNAYDSFKEWLKDRSADVKNSDLYKSLEDKLRKDSEGDSLDQK